MATNVFDCCNSCLVGLRFSLLIGMVTFTKIKMKDFCHFFSVVVFISVWYACLFGRVSSALVRSFVEALKYFRRTLIQSNYIKYKKGVVILNTSFGLTAQFILLPYGSIDWLGSFVIGKFVPYFSIRIISLFICKLFVTLFL